ncbi:MAG: hypothetical protein LBR08_10400 [Bacteroidales bacterium]|jgi:hypothetical protein|nr:hypothetical protein [Bacteroidales bacterium]
MKEELRKRRVEFLGKLRDLLEEYVAVVSYERTSLIDGDDYFYIVTDAHQRESWDNMTVPGSDLSEAGLQSAICKIEAERES